MSRARLEARFAGVWGTGVHVVARRDTLDASLLSRSAPRRHSARTSSLPVARAPALGDTGRPSSHGRCRRPRHDAPLMARSRSRSSSALAAVFYSQMRVGSIAALWVCPGDTRRQSDCGGKPFRIFKFRTMTRCRRAGTDDEVGRAPTTRASHPRAHPALVRWTSCRSSSTCCA